MEPPPPTVTKTGTTNFPSINPGEDCTLVRSVSKDEIISLYSGRYKIPANLQDEFFSFDLYECNQSKLLFAWPMRPGSKQFYNWLVKQPQYYKKDRWEWEIIANEIGADFSGTLIDVGCGEGNFLSKIRDMFSDSPGRPQFKGVDSTPKAVETCRSRGFEVFEANIQEIAEMDGHRGSYQVVVATHLLEHVPDPMGFLEAAATLLAPGGKLFISTPYSPLTAEQVKSDPLNLPPHHLTQWNIEAYRSVATRLGLTLKPKFKNQSYALQWTRALWHLALPEETVGQRTQASTLLSYPALGARVIKAVIGDPNLVRRASDFMRQRDRIDNVVAPDLILAIFENS